MALEDWPLTGSVLVPDDAGSVSLLLAASVCLAVAPPCLGSFPQSRVARVCGGGPM